jgi:hypothetical protein
MEGLDRLTVIDLAQVVDVGADGITVDLDYMEDVLPKDRTIKEDKIRSLPVPEGMTWPEITLEVGESSLRVLARGQSWNVDLEEAGFADTRRKHGEADKLFQILLWFALHHGRLPLAEVTRRKDSPDGFRRQISNLRKRLGNLIPAEGESIRWDPEAEAYTCCFKILRGRRGDVAATRRRLVDELPDHRAPRWPHCGGRQSEQRSARPGCPHGRTRCCSTSREQLWHEYSLGGSGTRAGRGSAPARKAKLSLSSCVRAGGSCGQATIWPS